MTQGDPSGCAACGRPGGPTPLLTTSFVVTEASARAIGNAGMGRLWAVTGLGGVAIAGLLWAKTGVAVVALPAGVAFTVLLLVRIRTKLRRANALTLAPGAHWRVEYRPQRFTICDPLGSTTTVGYPTMAALTVKPAYAVLATVTGNRLVLPIELVPPAAQALFPTARR